MRAVLFALALGAALLTPAAAQFRSTAAGVNVFVRVLDRGKPVVGLTAADFEVTDNGVPQSITAAALEASPIDLTLLLDTSGSIQGAALERINQDILALERLLKPDDRIGLLAFAETVRAVLPLREWRSQRGNVALPAGGGTALLHGLAAALLRPSEAGRPHLIMALTDGIDTASFLSTRDLLDIAERSDAVLHVVLRRASMGPLPRAASGAVQLSITQPPGSGWRPRGAVRMADIGKAAEATGGLLTGVDVAKPLPDVFTSAIADFRSSYQLWFSPQGVSPDGWHDLAVRVKRGKYEVAARRGYFGVSGR